MTKANITQYDKVAANNTDVQDVPLGENLMYPADVNNAFREVMADLAAVNDGTVAFTSPAAGSLNVTTNIVVGGTVDGRDVAADGTKLDGIEAGATADQTGAEIASAISGETVSTLTINGGSITGITDLAVADGGTGASTAEAARANLDVDPAGTAVALAIALG